ncbi:hypothetical protein BLA29_001498 [Euroglyphus maynei]|uniref:ZP domain-containing protein n=1 Tax=Euroglyphus maynei TaxID=6958 RepID=A0A1Y3ASU0_EURMA|nr:hypothetical protein BLA29_001498 [Euroglyphus maynei]
MGLENFKEFFKFLSNCKFCIIGLTFGVVPQITRLNVQCDRSGMKVMVEFDNTFNGIIFSKGHFSDPNCRYVNAAGGLNVYEFFVSSSSCGTLANELVAVTNDGKDVPQGFKNNDPDYQEVWDSARRLSCDWVTRLEKTVTFAPFGVDMLGVKELRFPGDTVDCWMDIQRGHGPFAPTVGGVVPIGEKLTVVIYVRDSDKSFDVHVKDCYAYDTPDYRNPNAHAIKLTDERGCPLKEKLVQGFFRTLDVRDSGATVIAYGIINAFKFPEKMDVFLACNVEVCKGGCLENVCQPIVEVAGQDSATNTIASGVNTELTTVGTTSTDEGSSTESPAADSDDDDDDAAEDEENKKEETPSGGDDKNKDKPDDDGEEETSDTDEESSDSDSTSDDSKDDSDATSDDGKDDSDATSDHSKDDESESTSTSTTDDDEENKKETTSDGEDVEEEKSDDDAAASEESTDNEEKTEEEEEKEEAKPAADDDAEESTDDASEEKSDNDEETTNDDDSSSTVVAGKKGGSDEQTKEGDEAEITNGDEEDSEEERKKRKISTSLKLKAKKSSKVLKAAKKGKKLAKSVATQPAEKSKKPKVGATASTSTAPPKLVRKSTSLKKKPSEALRKQPTSTTAKKIVKKKSVTRPSTAKLIRKPASRSTSSSARLPAN